MEYCTAVAVANLIGQTSGFFTGSSSPTLAQVEDLIERKSAELERRTNRAWRERTANREYYDVKNFRRWGTGRRVFLRHRGVKDLVSASNDSLQVWNGSTWEEWLGTFTQGREGDFWIQPEDGYLYMIGMSFYRPEALRITYRYTEGADTLIDDSSGITDSDTSITVDSTIGFENAGQIRIGIEDITYTAITSTTITGCTRGEYGTTAAAHTDNSIVYQIPRDVQNLVAKMVALELTLGDDYSVLFPEGTQNIPLPDKRKMFQDDIERELSHLQEVRLPV